MVAIDREERNTVRLVEGDTHREGETHSLTERGRETTEVRVVSLCMDISVWWWWWYSGGGGGIVVVVVVVVGGGAVTGLPQKETFVNLFIEGHYQ